MGSNIIEIDGLYKSFSREGLRKEAGVDYLISNLNLTIPSNKITALVGGNGTGKTTLFNIISGFLKEDKGNIYFFNSKSIKINSIASYKREHLGIGRLFQDNHIFPNLTVIENLIITDRENLQGTPSEAIFFRNKIREKEKILSKKAIDLIIHFLGESSELLDKLDDLGSSLSFGQRRLLGLIRLFMSDYKLVLLDEPTSGISPVLYDVISFIIKQMISNKGMTVFLIEHNMNFVRKTANQCLFIDEGQIKVKGTPSEVLSNEYVQKSYLGV